MKLLFLSWRDIKHPKKGGAEVFTHEMLKRNTKKHEIVHFSPIFSGSLAEEVIDGVTYMRKGNMLTVLWYAWRFNACFLPDVVVDQQNTHHFFTFFWVLKKKRVLFIHQLTREIWFEHFRGFFWPCAILGWLFEPLFLYLHRKSAVLTVSDSTKEGLMGFGIPEKNITLLPEGLNFSAWDKKELCAKENVFTVLYAGRFSKYKGVFDLLKAINEVQKTENVHLWLIGKASNAEKVKINAYVRKNGLENVKILGFVSKKEKLERMSRAHVLVIPSRREGWGLVVTEANAVGTMAIGYDSFGLKDSIRHGKTGILCKKSPFALAESLKKVKNCPENRIILEKNAHAWAKTFSWNNTGRAFEHWVEKKIN